MEHERPSLFSIDVREESGQHVVCLRGELDLSSAQDTVRRLEAIAGSTIIVDLHDLTFLDAAGLSALLRAKTSVEQAGHRFKIQGVRGLPARVIKVADLEALLLGTQPTREVG